MNSAPVINLSYRPTDGDIALNNLESARQQSWSLFWQEPLRPGIAEGIVEQEQLMLQFLGDLNAFDRLETLVSHLERVAESPYTALIHAQVASMSHRFAGARGYLAKAEESEEFAPAANRLMLSIDQACGTRLEAVLEARKMAAESGRLEDLVVLGALQADLREFDEADRTYQRALREYRQTSPFAVAWVCFQLGSLWGELVPEPQLNQAAYWYSQSIKYVPRYVRARVHLAEIYLIGSCAEEAGHLLVPMISTGDPEVQWHLADVLFAMGKAGDGAVHLEAARLAFEKLLRKHLLAFADHGAEFYLGSGNDCRRALELAKVNLANRPTVRALRQTYNAATQAGDTSTADELLIRLKAALMELPTAELSN